MRISRWMKGPVITIRSRDTVGRARSMLAASRINQLVVCDEGRLVGIVTDRDVRAASPEAVLSQPRGSREGLPDPDDLPVETVMTHQVVTLRPTDTVEDAARLMRQRRIGSIPIVDGKEVVGMLTRSDVIDALLSERPG